MIKYAHVIVDLQAGDTGKGKVANHLTKTGDYTHVVRYNGGGNAGHTVFHNDKKIVTHFIPVGVLHGVKSIIGPGCVIDPLKLIEESKQLEELGFDVKSNLFIDKRVHLIQKKHLEEDSLDTKIGTTKTGNGPSYRDKYGRQGVRAGDFLNENIIDIYEEFHNLDKEVKILFEGAQGFELDIDWGDYPYVTSSHCTVGGAILNGVPPQKIEKVFGVAKVYRTYVGNKRFENDAPVFEKIREEGLEYGATTGRKRQINWLDLTLLIKAIHINGVTDLIFNKLDILEKVNEFNLYFDSILITFDNIENFKNFIMNTVRSECESVKNITFSSTALSI